MARIGLTSDLHYGTLKKSHEILDEFWKECARKKPIDYWILAGDLAVSKPSQIYRCLKQFRQHIDTPAGLVWGNHDWWDQDGWWDESIKKNRRHTFEQLDNLHYEWCKEFDITHLTTPVMLPDDTLIQGFDGWYEPAYWINGQCPTNDDLWLPQYHGGAPIHQFMRHRAFCEFQALLENENDARSVVTVTHFPMYVENMAFQNMCANFNWLPPLIECSDVICFGHSHQPLARVRDGTLILNAGAVVSTEQHSPRYMIFET